MPDSIAIDGFGPIPLHSPADAAELGALVRKAEAVYPVGGGTHLSLGYPPSKTGIAVSMARFDRLIEHAARDMTVTVQAGMTMAALAKILARENQWLPIECGQPAKATIGGMIAANRSGPRRLGYGTLRDYAIGIRFVPDDGTEVKGGGRVVKNVAGYDLMKLHHGALGSLGIITEVTLKVRPKPEATALVAWQVKPEDIAGMLDRIHASAARPISVELGNSEGWSILCGFEEKRETVDWQIATLQKDVGAGRLGLPVSASEMGLGGEVLLKANVLPSQTATVALAMDRLGATAQAHAGNGIVYGSFPADTPESLDSHLATLAPLCTTANANLVVECCPPAWKSKLPIWGRDTGQWAMMRKIKAALDPRGVFNPGRLFS